MKVDDRASRCLLHSEALFFCPPKDCGCCARAFCNVGSQRVRALPQASLALFKPQLGKACAKHFLLVQLFFFLYIFTYVEFLGGNLTEVAGLSPAGRKSRDLDLPKGQILGQSWTAAQILLVP